MEQYMNGQAV